MICLEYPDSEEGYDLMDKGTDSMEEEGYDPPPVYPSSLQKSMAFLEPGFYEKQNAFKDVNNLSNLITICRGNSNLNWLVNQLVEYEWDVPEFILENINYQEINLDSDLIELLIYSQCLYRNYDDLRICDDNFIADTFRESIEDLEACSDESKMEIDEGDNNEPFSVLRNELLGLIEEKYNKQEEWLNLKEVEGFQLNYNQAHAKRDLIGMQKIWSTYTRLQRKLHKPPKRKSLQDSTSKLQLESKTRIEDHYTRVYPADQTQYLIYSSKNNKKTALLNLFPFFAKLASTGKQIKDEIKKNGSETRAKKINVVTVFLAFVVSTKPHVKNGNHHRVFVPICLDLKYENALLSKDLEDGVLSKEDPPDSFYEEIKKDHHHGSSLMFGKPQKKEHYTNEIDQIVQVEIQKTNLLHHSERVLFALLRKKENMQKIILLLEAEMLKLFKIDKLEVGLYKIYSMAILLYSTNSVCNYCSTGVVALQNSHDKGFIKAFTSALQKLKETKAHFKIRGYYAKEEKEGKSTLDHSKFKALTLVSSDKPFTPQARDMTDEQTTNYNPRAKMIFPNHQIDLHHARTNYFIEYVGHKFADKNTLFYPGLSFMSGSKKSLKRQQLDNSINKIINEEREKEKIALKK